MLDFHAIIAKLSLGESEILLSLSYSVVLVFCLWIAHRITLFFIQRQLDAVESLYRWRKGSSYFLSAIGILLLGRLWIQGFESLATVLGLVAAGIAIALKDVLTNIAGWIYILWDAPFAIGDRIEIESSQGDVIDIGLFKFTLLEVGNWVDADQSTGRLLKIPNTKVFLSTISNSTKGFNYIWNEIPVVLTFESNWKKGKTMLKTIIEEHSAEHAKEIEKSFRKAKKSMMVNYSRLTPTVYTNALDHGVCLTVRYLCQAKNRRGTQEKIWEAILEDFEAHDDLDLAYPTQRLYTSSA